MLAVDTNVLVRLLVDDPAAPRQCDAAREAALAAGSVYVPQVAQVETVWVLERAYALSKAGIVDCLVRMVQNAAYVIQRPDVFQRALQDYRTGRADFSDYVLLAESRVQQVKLATFDRKLPGQDGTMPLKA